MYRFSHVHIFVSQFYFSFVLQLNEQHDKEIISMQQTLEGVTKENDMLEFRVNELENRKQELSESSEIWEAKIQQVCSHSIVR